MLEKQLVQSILVCGDGFCQASQLVFTMTSVLPKCLCGPKSYLLSFLQTQGYLQGLPSLCIYYSFCGLLETREESWSLIQELWLTLPPVLQRGFLSAQSQHAFMNITQTSFIQYPNICVVSVSGLSLQLSQLSRVYNQELSVDLESLHLRCSPASSSTCAAGNVTVASALSLGSACGSSWRMVLLIPVCVSAYQHEKEL